jgi:uncharacterized membrane protein YeaQ/YmgE (transglycosylase-associated protein family)
MDLVVTGVVAGVLGTLVMDSLNLLFARTGMLSKIDVGMIGRMAAGWARGRFRYENPSQMEQVANEKLYGYLAHYTIGVGLAIPFVLGWDLWVGGPASPVWALAYGVSTTVASYFFVFPSMGFGVAGRRSPEGMRHLFYGVGIAVGIALV